MSFHTYSYATTKDTGHIALQMTLYCIAVHTSYETGCCYAKVKTLMDEAKVKSDRTMRNYIKKLCDAGFIKRYKRKWKRGGKASDALELVGFIEWNAIRRGVEVPVVDDEAKITGGGKFDVVMPDVRQDLPEGPVGHELPEGPVGHELPDIELQKSSISSTRVGAREPDGGSLARASVSRVAIDLTPDDTSWPDWISYLENHGKAELAERANQVCKMTVCKRWPRGDSLPLPKIPKPKTNITNRMIGEPEDAA